MGFVTSRPVTGTLGTRSSLLRRGPDAAQIPGRAAHRTGCSGTPSVHKAWATKAYRENSLWRLLSSGRRSRRMPARSARFCWRLALSRWRKRCRGRPEASALLRSGDGQIDAPIIHAKIDAGNGADAVYVEHRRMRGSIDRAPYRRNIACHPCRGLVVNDQHAFDRVRAVRPQRFLDTLWRGAGPPFLVLHHDIETDALRKIDPEVAELAKAGSQHFVARR